MARLPDTRSARSYRQLKIFLQIIGLLALSIVIGPLRQAQNVSAASDVTTVIQGVVLDGTTSSKLSSAVSVHLVGIDSSSHAPIADVTATADAAGHFALPAVPTSPTATYFGEVTYLGVKYQQALTRSADGQIDPVTITVYETTSSDTAIQVNSENWVFEGFDTDNQQVAILDTVTIVNAGDRTYIGDYRGDPGSDAPGVAPRTIRLPLTSGASSFAIESGIDPSALLPVAGGFVDTSPVIPGSHDIAYTYLISYAEGGAEIRNALPYSTRTLRFFAPNAGLDLRSDHLTSSSTATIQGKPYVILSANDIAPNTVVTVDVLGLPSTPASRVDPLAIRVAGLVVIALAVLAAVYFGLRPARAAQRSPGGERDTLFLEIARLDNSYAAGQIPADRYESERTVRKQRLVDLLVEDVGNTNVPGTS